MNPLDDQLDRLFRAAGQARLGPVPEPAYGVETRVLAAWRAGQGRDSGIWDVALLVRGLIVASVIMALSFLPALKSSSETTSPFADFVQLTDSTVSSDDAP
jgi:hypothetical protein